MIHPHYPTAEEVDAWCESLLKRAEGISVAAHPVDAPQYAYQLGVRHTSGNHYVAFESEGRTTFYGYWQPASPKLAPVLFHLPGYGAEMSAHPELVIEGYNVLHVNPLGYCTPTGPSKPDCAWTVLPDTVKTKGKQGYVDWLMDAVLAVHWALALPKVNPTRFGFFGSSQGGGTSLLMASIFADHGVRAIAADVPFLTNFPLMLGRENKGAYAGASSAMKSKGGSAGEWKALGYIDTLSHAHRLRLPTLLTAGSLDIATPPDSVAALFEALPGTRSYTFLSGQGHGYTMPFIHLAKAWFKLYV